jgi:transcription-repair coupling factor (superfamily II helicase)
LSVATEINLHAPALLPDDYCGDVHLRLSFYKKLATAKTGEQIDTCWKKSSTALASCRRRAKP